MRYHIPTLMKEVEQAIKERKPINPETTRILDAWWKTQKR